MAAAKEGQESIVTCIGGIQGAGAGGGFGLNKPGAGPKVTHFAGKGSGKKEGPKVPDEVGSMWEKLLSDEDPHCFMLATYSSNGKSLELVASGPEDGPPGGCGLDYFKSELEKHPNTCGWGGVRCNGVDNRVNTTSKRPKLIFVQWMPPGASSIRKSRMAVHKGLMKDSFHGAHVDILVEDPDEDLQPDRLVSQLQSSTGAHKPNGYEFNIGEITPCDYDNVV